MHRSSLAPDPTGGLAELPGYGRSPVYYEEGRLYFLLDRRLEGQGPVPRSPGAALSSADPMRCRRLAALHEIITLTPERWWTTRRSPCTRPGPLKYAARPRSARYTAAGDRSTRPVWLPVPKPAPRALALTDAKRVARSVSPWDSESSAPFSATAGSAALGTGPRARVLALSLWPALPPPRSRAPPRKRLSRQPAWYLKSGSQGSYCAAKCASLCTRPGSSWIAATAPVLPAVCRQAQAPVAGSQPRL